MEEDAKDDDDVEEEEGCAACADDVTGTTVTSAVAGSFVGGWELEARLNSNILLWQPFVCACAA